MSLKRASLLCAATFMVLSVPVSMSAQGRKGGVKGERVDVSREPPRRVTTETTPPTSPATSPVVDAPPVVTAPDPDAFWKIAPRRTLEFETQSKRVLPVTQSTDPTDAHPGKGSSELLAEDTIGRLALARSYYDDWKSYPEYETNYSAAHWPVTHQRVDGFGTDTFDVYTIGGAHTKAVKFSIVPLVVLYRFEEVEDQLVYELQEDNSLKFVVAIPAAQVSSDGYTRIPEIVMRQKQEPRRLVFVPASQGTSRFTYMRDRSVRAGRLTDTEAGRVVQVRYTLPATPFDMKKSFDYGPSSWALSKGHRREFHPVVGTKGPGLVWQGAEDDQIYVTWLLDELPEFYAHQMLPSPDGFTLGSATFNHRAGVDLLLIESGTTKPLSTRKVMVLRTDSWGKEVARVSLDASKEGLNVTSFSDGDHAVMRRSGDRLGIIMTRTMHKSSDGLHHQGGTTIVLDTKTLDVVGPGWGDSPGRASQTSSHSFSNVLYPAGKNEFLGADLGDAYPRGVHVYRLKQDRSIASKVAFTCKTVHGTSASAYSGGPSYPVYDAISSREKTYYQWSNDNATYTELGGLAETSEGIVTLFATERSLLDNTKLGAAWNESRELTMVRMNPDFESVSKGKSSAWVTDDLVRSKGLGPFESEYYSFGGGRIPQRVTGVVFLTSLPKDQSVTRPHLHKGPDGLIALYEVWRTTPYTTTSGYESLKDTYLETYAMRLDDKGMPRDSAPSALGDGVRLPGRDDPFTWAGGTAIATGEGDELVVTLILPPRKP